MDAVPPLTFLVTIAFIGVQFFGFQNAIGPDSPMSLGFFKSSVGNTSSKYPSPLSPAGYTLSIWGLIYTWWPAWIIYVITTLFRTNAKGPVYLNPPVTTPAFLIASWLILTLNVTWLFTFDRETFILCVVVLVLSSSILYLALALHTTKVYEYIFVLKENGRFDFWANQTLIHNGVAIYATWNTVATVLNLALALIYRLEVDQDTAVYIGLGVFASLLITYFILDCFVYDRYLRYVLIVYPTAMWALGGILVANIDQPNSPQAVVGSTLFALVFVFFLIKTVLVIIRDPVTVIAKQRAAEKDGCGSHVAGYSPVMTKV